MASAQPVPAGGQTAAGVHSGVGAQSFAGAHPVAARSAAAAVRPPASQAGEASAASRDSADAGPGQALVPSPPQPGDRESEAGFGPLVASLPVELDVAVPVREFRVRHLLALEPGSVVESRWNHGKDLPLAAGDVQLAWTEFEVIETHLAVRVTRLA